MANLGNHTKKTFQLLTKPTLLGPFQGLAQSQQSQRSMSLRCLVFDEALMNGTKDKHYLPGRKKRPKQKTASLGEELEVQS